MMAPHILFLDEPTNNLDIESIDALCQAIREFNGGVVLVSHDARLIESTNCRMWVVDKQCVEPFAGNFEGYRGMLLAQLEEQMAAHEREVAEKRAATMAEQERRRAGRKPQAR
jgi:ATP-binding cassette subfamily F protein 1